MKQKTIVLITGVSREEGIGYGLANYFNEHGYDVIATARNLEKVEALAKTISSDKGSVTAEPLDITDDASVENLRAFIEARFGRLDILINNAGGHLDYMVGPLETNFDNTRQALETNLFGTWRVIKGLVPLLKKSKHPRIVNISSGAGSFSHPIFGLPVHQALLTSYGLSKLALNGLTVQLARELKKENILVNAVNPGFVATAPGMTDMGARSVKDSMDGIAYLAQLPDDGPTGKFFEDKKEISW